MKRLLQIFLIAVAVASPCAAEVPQQQKISGRSCVIGFYNLENLFDTYHDEGKNDYDFLPDGANQWTEAKYQKKLHNMARVIRAMKEDNGRWHAVLGICEIENRHVVEDLVSQPEIAEADYQIVHYDGPDIRGVDVGLLYKPEVFTLIASESIPFTLEPTDIPCDLDSLSKVNFRTRDILMARGTIDGEMFAFYVAHLPSRIGGKGIFTRARGGEIIYNHAMALSQEFPGIRIVVMGDMNDNPTDDSQAVYLRGREKIEDMEETDFFSPFLSMFKAGYGSLAYQGAWNIYDIIQVNYQLAVAPDGGFKIQPIHQKGYYGRIFKKDWMTQKSGPYKGTPFRTFSGGAFVGGYSDHYPTYIVVSK